MKKFSKLFLALAITSISLSVPFTLKAESGINVSIDYNEDSSYDIWTGPGWYYGIWFNNEDDYEYWIENHYNDVIWVGPGWYYGFWFDSEDNFHNYRKNHGHHERHRRGQGNPALHQQQYRSSPQGTQLQKAQPQSSQQPMKSTQPKVQQQKAQQPMRTQQTQKAQQSKIQQPKAQQPQRAQQPKAPQHKAQEHHE